jgi:hypothetical protein
VAASIASDTLPAKQKRELVPQAANLSLFVPSAIHQQLDGVAMRQTVPALLTLFIFVLGAVLNPAKNNAARGKDQYDIIVRNGRVIDGSGSPAFSRDQK